MPNYFFKYKINKVRSAYAYGKCKKNASRYHRLQKKKNKFRYMKF